LLLGYPRDALRAVQLDRLHLFGIAHEHADERDDGRGALEGGGEVGRVGRGDVGAGGREDLVAQRAELVVYCGSGRGR
jgi:hypothetical protein